MRPIIVVALAFLVLSIALFTYFVVQSLNAFHAVANARQDAVLAAKIETGCVNYMTEYNRLPPSGDNQKLTAALLGDNSRQVVFIALSKSEMNSNNEVVDRWGTPLRMNLQTAGVQIISAGPDKIFGTPDDIVTNPPVIRPGH